MSTDSAEVLRQLTTCRCDPAWTGRRLHDPRCLEEYREDVDEALATAEARGYQRAVDELRAVASAREPGHGPAAVDAATAERRRLSRGRLSAYLEPRDAWVGVYVAERAVYVCLVPFVVLRWRRG